MRLIGREGVVGLHSSSEVWHLRLPCSHCDVHFLTIAFYTDALLWNQDESQISSEPGRWQIASTLVLTCWQRYHEQHKHQSNSDQGPFAVVCHPWARICYVQPTYQICSLYLHNFHWLDVPGRVFSSWQWQFTGVWTAAHRRTCRTTVFRPPVLTLGSVPPTVNCLQYLAAGSTLTAVGPFQLLARPTVWKSLPDFIRDPIISADCFRRFLKTCMFARY